MSVTTLTTENPLPPLPAGVSDDYRMLITGLRIVREVGRGVLVERIDGGRGVAWLPLNYVRLHAVDFFMTVCSASVPAWVYRQVQPLL